MSPAPRKPENRGLPRNLHRHPNGFRYRVPGGSYVYLGFDRAAAVEAACRANEHFASKSPLFNKIVTGNAKTLADVISDYVSLRLPKLEIKEDTKNNRRWALQKMALSDVAQLTIEEITTRDLYLYIESLESGWVKQSYRALLNQIFVWAIQTGLRSDNPATALERTKAKRERPRMTLEVFQAIWAHSPAWLRNAMDLQLLTLQRPGDVVAMRWDDVTSTGLRVVQQKTGRRMELVISQSLREVLSRCRDDVLSPFLVHRRPERLRPMNLRAKHREHHSQVLLEQAERAFDRARKATGLYAKGEKPTTLHEIRSLGGHLYQEKAGWSEEQVQRLMGHTETKMTRHYLAGHEAPWERVEAGMSLALIRY